MKRVTLRRIIIVLCVFLCAEVCTFAYLFTSGDGSYNRNLNLGNKYLLSEDYDDAIRAFSKAIEVDEKKEDAYIGRGDAYKAKGDYASAWEDYEKAQELSGDTDLLRNKIGETKISVVSENGEGVEGAAIRLNGADHNYEFITDSKGRIAEVIFPEEYKVEVKKDEYEPLRTELSAANGGFVAEQIQLSKAEENGVSKEERKSESTSDSENSVMTNEPVRDLKPSELEGLPIIEYDEYKDNEGDSFIYPIGRHQFSRGNKDITGKKYEHGIEAWIARWNYEDELSWAYSVFSIPSNYNTFSGKVVLIDSYNTENFDSTLYFFDADRNVSLGSYRLTPSLIPLEFSISVSNVSKLKIYVADNKAVSGGTSFGLVDNEDLDQVDNTALKENTGYQELYADLLRELSRKATVPSRLTFQLIYLDGDDIPELVTAEGHSLESQVSIYTIPSDRVMPIYCDGNNWGNHGLISYCEHENLILNSYTTVGSGEYIFYRIYDEEVLRVKGFSKRGEEHYIEGNSVSQKEYDAAFIECGGNRLKSAGYDTGTVVSEDSIQLLLNNDPVCYNGEGGPL